MRLNEINDSPGLNQYTSHNIYVCMSLLLMSILVGGMKCNIVHTFVMRNATLYIHLL